MLFVQPQASHRGALPCRFLKTPASSFEKSFERSFEKRVPWRSVWRAGRQQVARPRAAEDSRQDAAPASPVEAAVPTTASSTHSSPSVDSNALGPADFDAWFTGSTMLQLLVLILGLGYAGVPLVAQLLSGLHIGEASTGLDQAAALCLIEAAVLLGVRSLLQRRLAAEEAEGRWVARLQYRWDPRSLAIGLGAGAAAVAINNAAELLQGGPAQQQPETVGAVASILATHDWLSATLLFVGSAIFAPAAEEMAYRGFLLPSLQRALPMPAAVAAVAAVFAAAHLDPSALGQLAVVGACLGTAAVASGGNLAAPTAGHILYNASLYVSLALAPGASG